MIRRFRFFSVYGFANRYKEGIRPNCLLIASIVPFISEVGLPLIIAGDFNEPLVKLPSFKYFLDMGVIEAFQWYRTKNQSDRPATCCGPTRNDTAFMHPMIAHLIEGMSVPAGKKFDVHTPLLVDFKLARRQDKKNLWKCPNTWAPFSPPSEVIGDHYEPVDFNMIFPDCGSLEVVQVETSFQSWPKHVEKAVDRALQTCHQRDPIRYPRSCLGKSYKGRCNTDKFRKVQPRTSVKSDRHGGFTRPCDVFRLSTKLKVRQTRRTKSLDDPAFASSIASAKEEWKKILSAKGYGSSWKHWILSFESVTSLPLILPNIDDLHMMEQITEHDCIHACGMEAKFRKDRFKCRMTIDQNDDFCKTSYSLVRAKHFETLAEVPASWKIPAKLLRARVGHTALLLDFHKVIPKHATLRFGEADIHLVYQIGFKLFFRHIGGVLMMCYLLVSLL